jgi:hypothetical protein
MEMKRSSLYSLLALGVLAIAAFYALNREGEVSSTGEPENMLVDYDSAAVDKLEISSPTASVVLEKQAGVWMLTSPLRYKADESAVASAVGKGRTIGLTSVISTNPEKQHLFQVDSTGTFVKVYERGTAKAAFYVGKASSSFSETFVRVDGSSEVQLANEALAHYFHKQPKDWRDKTIFKVDEGSIKSIRFRYGDTTFALSLQDSLWRVEKDSANQTAVQQLLTAVANIQSDAFIDSSLTAIPKLTAVLQVEGTEIRFFKKDDTKYLVQTSQSPQWFELQNWRTTNLLKRKKDLLPPSV